MNKIASENGYGILLVFGAALIVAYFVRADAALLWTGGALAVLGAAGERLKSLKASPTGIEVEQYKARTVAEVAKRVAASPALSEAVELNLNAQLSFSGHLDAVKNASARERDMIDASTGLHRRVLEGVASALTAPTPEAFADQLVALTTTYGAGEQGTGTPLPLRDAVGEPASASVKSVKSSEHL